MDRAKITYPLHIVKELIANGKCEFTRRALETIQDHFGETEAWAWEVMLSLDSRRDFYKSTNSNHNHKIWLDVYKTRYDDFDIYIKFQLVGDRVIGQEIRVTSFKTDESSF